MKGEGALASLEHGTAARCAVVSLVAHAGLPMGAGVVGSWRCGALPLLHLRTPPPRIALAASFLIEGLHTSEMLASVPSSC
eukprot:15444712-Alexandrium_andersonii.AAC.1